MEATSDYVDNEPASSDTGNFVDTWVLVDQISEEINFLLQSERDTGGAVLSTHLVEPAQRLNDLRLLHSGTKHNSRVLRMALLGKAMEKKMLLDKLRAIERVCLAELAAAGRDAPLASDVLDIVHAENATFRRC
eukprot:TRINITY_DN31065_c0_g1_i1.p1 TRINITY_DN31065_c0_g1~~TRINITY_DN31065_c0_g1_i1.p1  ORF type:complete len:134 (+),score=25.47 TRINITY_DN31065_c0_g1_i1:95-496(+)